MGMFDSVMVTCPKCRNKMEFQSKALDCLMEVYTLETAPAEILLDIMNSPHFHVKCGQWVVLIDPNYPPPLRPKPTLSPAMVIPPNNPIKHFQGDQWWPNDVLFTFDHLEPETTKTPPAGEGERAR